MMDVIPTILVFDSGIGGISVYNEIRLKIPNANYIYLFDNEAFPYGDKSNDFLIDRVQAVINKAILQFSIDIIVIACNTASTICLPHLRSLLNIPIVGVVPAIKPAINLTKNKCIGLLATKATIQREYTHQLIRDFATGYQIELLGLSELALMAEQKIQGITINSNVLRQLMKPWLDLEVIPDTIVLGCTHYPFIQPELASIFPQSKFIDSGYAIAARVYNLLADKFNLVNLIPHKLTDSNIVCSTQYNKSLNNLIEKLHEFNLFNYQHISV